MVQILFKYLSSFLTIKWNYIWICFGVYDFDYAPMNSDTFKSSKQTIILTSNELQGKHNDEKIKIIVKLHPDGTFTKESSHISSKK